MGLSVDAVMAAGHLRRSLRVSAGRRHRPPGAWMGALQRLFQVGHGDAGVNVGGLERLVSEQPLHINDVRAVGDQMRGVTVPPDVRRDVPA